MPKESKQVDFRLGANREQRLVAFMTAIPNVGLHTLTFTPAQAREIAAQILVQADIADGTQDPPVVKVAKLSRHVS